jgi:hypothetical protein
MTMDRVELVRCMREAADALAEFRHFLHVYCPEAMAHYEQALLHFDVALALCGRARAADGDDDKPPTLRIKW